MTRAGSWSIDPGNAVSGLQHGKTVQKPQEVAYVSVLTDSRCDSLDGLVYFGLGGMRVHDALPCRSQAGAQTVSQPPAPKLVVP
jgi:hypothetical protein